MKKIILSLIILLFGLSASAQIKRTIYGCTLGESTASQVESIMLNKEGVIRITGHPGGSDYMFYFSKDYTIKFAGVYWSLVSFEFYKNKLCEIKFSTDKYTNNLKTMLENLQEKYEYYELDNTGLGSDIIKRYFDLSIFIIVDKDEDFYGIRYTDYDLIQQKFNDDKDDL